MITTITNKLFPVQHLQGQLSEATAMIDYERKELENAKQQVDSLERALKRETRRRNVAWPKPARRLPAVAVRDALHVTDENELWQAVHQELDDAIAEVLDEVTQDPGSALTSERRTHLAGGGEYLRRFQKRLLDIQAASLREDPDLEEKVK